MPWRTVQDPRILGPHGEGHPHGFTQEDPQGLPKRLKFAPERKHREIFDDRVQPYPHGGRPIDSMGTMTDTAAGWSYLPVPANAAKRLVSFENVPEAELIRYAQKGDEQAFAEIIQRHQNMVFSVAYRMVRRRMDAEDVAQQVFAKIFYALKKFDMRSSLSTWIYKIAMNETYDYLRRLKSRRVVYDGDLTEDFDDSESRSARIADARVLVDEQSEKRDYLMKLLAHVTEEERTLLFLKEVEGLTIDELAERTGINGNTIKVKLFRARKKLVTAAAKLDGQTGSDMG